MPEKSLESAPGAGPQPLVLICFGLGVIAIVAFSAAIHLNGKWSDHTAIIEKKLKEEQVKRTHFETNLAQLERDHTRDWEILGDRISTLKGHLTHRNWSLAAWEALARAISLEGSDLTLSEVVLQIGEKTGVDVVIGPGVSAVKRRFPATSKPRTAIHLLQEGFRNTDVMAGVANGLLVAGTVDGFRRATKEPVWLGEKLSLVTIDSAQTTLGDIADQCQEVTGVDIVLTENIRSLPIQCSIEDVPAPLVLHAVLAVHGLNLVRDSQERWMVYPKGHERSGR